MADSSSADPSRDGVPRPGETRNGAAPRGAAIQQARVPLREVARLWWVPLVRGVMLLALGGYALLTPGLTLAAYTAVLGAFVLLDGLVAIAAGALGWVESRLGTVARGVVAVLAASFVLTHPMLVGVVAVTTLAILLAIQSIACGVIEVVTAIRERNEIEGEWWMVLGGLLSIVFGGVLLSAPILAGEALVRGIGVFGMIAGAILVYAALRLRRFAAQRSSA